jgi:hypothetical protein
LHKFLDNLKRQAEENPIFALATGAAVLQAVSRLVNTNTARKNSKAWQKEVDRRVKKSK